MNELPAAPLRLVNACCRCRAQVQVAGSRWCSDCWYSGIDADYERLQDMLEEGYPRFQARIMVGWDDPPEPEER